MIRQDITGGTPQDAITEYRELKVLAYDLVAVLRDCEIFIDHVNEAGYGRPGANTALSLQVQIQDVIARAERMQR